MEKLMRQYCREMHIKYGSVRFQFDGERIDPSATPQSLELESDFCLDVLPCWHWRIDCIRVYEIFSRTHCVTPSVYYESQLDLGTCSIFTCRFYITCSRGIPFSSAAGFYSPLPPLGQVGCIWDVVLVWGRGILRKLSLCHSIVYYYNDGQRYEQFLQVGRLYRALNLLGLALSCKHLCLQSPWCYM